MDRFNKHKKFSVVFIPDYLVTTLETKGKSLRDIDSIVGKIGTSELIYTRDVTSRTLENENIRVLNEWFIKNMSKMDILDLITANDIFFENILDIRRVRYKNENDRHIGTFNYVYNALPEALHYNLDSKQKLDLISHYQNKDVDLNTIIMSRDTNTDSVVWSMVVTENTLFIVMHPGFSNFIVYNNLKFKEYFVTRLVDCLFKMFGEDAVVNHRIFKSFIRL